VSRGSDEPGAIALTAGPEPGMVAGPWRLPLIALGWLCVGLGIVGFVVPLMPGTVFLLVALWAFSRSSLRFHNWLYHHRWLGPPLRSWDAHGVISRPAKGAAVAMMAGSLGYVTLFVAEGLALPLALAAVMVPVVAYILSRPDRPGGPAGPPTGVRFALFKRPNRGL